MTWLRLHRLPQKVRRVPIELRGAKEEWLSRRSYLRWLRTEDAKQLIPMIDAMLLQGEIGNVQSIRFL